jgi:NAD(P) transhydrogenase
MGVAVARGLALVESPRAVRIEGKGVLEADRLVIATGSAPRRPPTLPFDDRVVCDYQSFLRTNDLPGTVLVLGAEEEGCELACLLAALGAHVTLVERREKLFRSADRDILGHLHDGLRSAGITVVNGDDMKRMDIVESGGSRHARVTFSSGRVEICELALVVAGRVARVPRAGDRVPLALDDRGFIIVDGNFATSVDGVYAIGDVTGPPFRIGSALFQARAAAAAALGADKPTLPDLPTAIWTIPQIATVGLGEDVARRLGLRVSIGTAREEDLEVCGTTGAPLRLLKLVFDGNGEHLVGVQIAGGAASELINLGAALIASGATMSDLAMGVFSHPSQGDAFRIAANATLARVRAPRRLTATPPGRDSGPLSDPGEVSPW